MTANFERWEFACRCGCGFDAINPQLVENLQHIRDRAKRAIAVNSGCRCKTHNRREGGKPRSYHLLGQAADIRMPGRPARELHKLAVDSGLFTGIGLYSSFVHVDIRPRRYRWTA